MTKLKESESEKSAVSHEAKLGVMVITILTFAFGFLVYHKMDLHQRKLTEASIASTAPDSDSAQPLDTAAQIATQSEKSAATDPLIARSALSDGSPFSDNDSMIAEPAGTQGSSSVSPDQMDPSETLIGGEFNANAMALDEPTDSSTAFSHSQTVDNSAALASGSPGFDSFEPSEMSNAVVATESPLNVTSDDVVAAATDAISLSPDNVLASTADTTGGGFAENVQPSEASSEFGFDSAEDVVPQPVDLVQQDASDFSSSPVAAGSDQSSTVEPSRSFSASELASVAASKPAAAAKKEEEPILLAMAEPQQESLGFDSFTADDTEVTSRQAPTSEPEDSFPSLDATESKSTTNPMAATAQQGSSFGSKGFDAVRKPNSRSGKNPVRTAAGSGADGKFSLAAFNYNNSGAQPAPDDGSTFDSVIVQNGDNYTKISKRVYGTIHYFSALAVFNQHRITEPRNMRPGMIVLTPPKELLEERYPQLFEDLKPREVEPAGFLLLDDGSPAYRVGERETLSDVSKRYLGRSSRWIEIYRLNQSVVPDPNKLKAGLILALPADAVEVNLTP